MAEIMRKMFLVAFLLLHAGSVEGYEFRLLPTNLQDTEGFVAIFYNGSWGLIGNPEFRFSDDTASLLCKKFNLSNLWFEKLECNGNELSIDECVKIPEWPHPYTYPGLLRFYGSKLYCVDYRLIGGLSQNTGMLLTAFNSTQHSMCYQGFDSSAGEVVCKHLRYNGLVAFTEGDPGSIPLFNNKLTCTGNESSLNECTMSNAVIENCKRAVYITCKAVRLTPRNEHNHEGVVEIFYDGSWAFLEPEFNDVTAQILCKTLGFRNVGGKSRRRLFVSHVGNVWIGQLSCNGTETDIMQCRGHSGFYLIPQYYVYSDFAPYFEITLLYCFGTDQCQSNPCLNNGTCANGDRSFTCNCTERWSGINCEIDTDQCQSNPCLNKGTCVDGDRSYTCTCTERWSGINCEIDLEYNKCQKQPCDNNSTCINYPAGYKCVCTEGYNGDNCAIDIDECLSAPCENNGNCTDSSNRYICSCVQGYGGERCQIEVGDQTTLIVVLISSICVLSIVLATVCCCLRYRREYKKTKSDASNELNSGKGGSQNTKEVEAVQKEMEERHYNEDVYDEIKENTVADVADYIHPVTDVELPRDAAGYVKFADNDQSVESDASNVLNSSKGGSQNTKEVEAVQKEMEEGQYNEDVYDKIKENTVADVADYLNPITDVVHPEDADGYVEFADNDQSVESDASNVLNSGKGNLRKGTTEAESVPKEIKGGHYNEAVYDEIKENTVADVYDGIKEITVADVADYTNPVTDVVQPRDADGYVKFADNDQCNE